MPGGLGAILERGRAALGIALGYEAMNPGNGSGLDALAGRLRREHYFYALWRLLLAVLLIALAFSPLLADPVVPRRSLLFQISALLYLALALFGLWLSRRAAEPHRGAVIIAVLSDVAAAVLAQHVVPSAANGIAFLLLVSVGAGAVLLPPRIALSLAAAAAVALLLEPLLWSDGLQAERSLFEAILLGVAYVGLAALAYLLARAAASEPSARRTPRRGGRLAGAAQRTDHPEDEDGRGGGRWSRADRARQCRGASSARPGTAGWRGAALDGLVFRSRPPLPALARRGGEDGATVVSPKGTNVAVHFSAVNPERGLYAIFLEDQSQLARRAQELTLSSLGRLSAGIAHEIRNPLAAISHAAQLIAESPSLSEGDRALLAIVLSQSQRMNGIVESVLQLARRGPAELRDLELVRFGRELVEEYESLYDLAGDELKFHAPDRELVVRADPGHLRQVIWNLLDNARRHGRRPGEPARVSVSVREDETGCPVLEVRDRGPGIPPQIAARIFEPFFTTSEFGTGLGLYIASELCAASGAELSHVPVAAGGSCFRIRFARRKPLSD